MAVQDHAIVRVWRRQAGKSDEYLGSAFLLSPRHLLTCLHVVGKQDTREPIPARECFFAGPTPGGGKEVIGRIEVHPDRDVALLVLPESAPDIDLPPLPLSAAKLAVGVQVTLKGFSSEDSGLESPTVTVSSYAGSKPTFIAHTYIGKGFSGGAVLFNGELAGVVHAKDAGRNQTHIIPLAQFEEFLNHQIDNTFAKSYAAFA